MAIEDHPKFADWSKALDRLTSARDEYALHKGCTNESEKQALEREVRAAFREFNRISDEIDA